MTGQPMADSQRPSRVRNVARIVGKFASLTLAIIIASLVVSWIAFPQAKESINRSIDAAVDTVYHQPTRAISAFLDGLYTKMFGCESDEDCPNNEGGLACVQSKCSVVPDDIECVSNAGCAVDEACKNARCVSPPECAGDEDCNSYEICSSNGECIDAGNLPLATLCVEMHGFHVVHPLLSSYDSEGGLMTNRFYEPPEDRLKKWAPRPKKHSCKRIQIEPEGFLELNAELDGGGGLNYLVVNKDAQRCAMHPDFMKVTVDGRSVDVRMLPQNVDPWTVGADPENLVPAANRGCNGWVKLKKE